MADRDFDLIVYGATGFTGRLVAEYLATAYADQARPRWAMAGRSEAKLAEVRDLIGAPADTPFVIADASDPASLKVMAARATVILTTVGPYQLYGSDLVAACVEAGTAYVDLCGEPGWMREMIDAHAARAKETGARIVFSCGFDSIPFDLGVLTLQEAARERFGRPCPRVKGRVRAMKGGFSGGTAASLKATLAAAARNPSLIALLTNPFALTPGFQGASQPLGMIPEYDRTIEAWVAPFIMAPINTKNVHRTNFLLGKAYGADFVYDEMMVAGLGDMGKAAAEAIAKMNPLSGDKGPKPGEGPSKEERESGHYDLLFVGEMGGGVRLDTVVTGDKDPGYGSTSKMIAEAALCLIEDVPEAAGGVWTPGAIMGAPLRKRLIERAGLTFNAG
ncbi:MAG: saccharopine dehydrogenase [Proteobacteria bacterium SG_bin5]|nr:MAG: saccharopine dehydrogenase [Proteobacteria bacterium SG_bin5]